jgi:alanine racemase
MSLTWIEIDKKNLEHNFKQFKKIANHSELWPVVKSNAYGHGLSEVIKILDKDKNASGFMVVNLEEALQAVKLTKKPIMVLSYFAMDEDMLKKLAHKKISLPVYDLDMVDYLEHLGKKLKSKFDINIKIDCGTSRLGFKAESAEEAIEYVTKQKHLRLHSIFTHYAESEAEDKSFTREQFNIFNEIAGKYFDIKMHSACSASAISMPETQQDIVRVGIGLYGLWPSQATRQRGEQLGIKLRPVMSFKSKVVQIKDLRKGDSVGYNRTYTCSESCKLAILPVGYNEGYSRLFSNKAKVLIKGKRYSVRGNICMNLAMIELPASTHIKVGEQVTLLGHDGHDDISAEELAELSQTINYEVVTKIKKELPRQIV